MKQLLLTTITVILSLNIFAQYKCGTDYYDSIAVAKNPSIIQKRLELKQFTEEYLKHSPKFDDTLIIPVVFHVLHKYGNEHISVESIENGIKQINADYSKQNNDLSNVISEFKNIIGDVKVKFRLAKIDPDGNGTTGVVYYNTDLTYNASNLLKYTIQNWDPSSYLNIWTVSSIGFGAAAWSHYPGITPELDGVVAIYRYVTSGHTLSHEIGHYLNLAHPWGSTNEPGVPSNCDMDDGVDDTPLTIGVDQHCNLDQVSCGSLDNVQNFMDYSTCDAMFTIGQTERMRAALNSSVSGRKYLWTNENLVETGTNDGYEAPTPKPVADFIDEIPDILPNDTIQFIDYTYNSTPDTWNWTFENGSPSSSNEQNPFVSYSEPGLYKVSLTVNNSAGTNTLTRNKLVFVIDTLRGIVAPAVVDMEDTEFPNYPADFYKTWTFKNSGEANWELYSNGNKAMRIKNYDNKSGTINTMITSNINLSEIDNYKIYFDYAYAQINSSSLDQLRVYVSFDCGKSWILKFLNSGSSLSTSNNQYVVSSFVPQYDEWATEEIDLSRYKDKNYMKIKFQMVSKEGNYLYIDNISIGKPANISNNSIISNSLKLYPNPASNNLTVRFNSSNNQNVTLSITSILGTTVFTKNINAKIGENINNINLNKLNIPKGIYLVMISEGNTKIAKRLIIK